MTLRKWAIVSFGLLLCCVVALTRQYCKPKYPAVPMLPTTLSTLVGAYGQPTTQRSLEPRDLAEFRAVDIAQVQISSDTSWLRSEWRHTCFGKTNERMVVVTKAADDDVVAMFTTRSYW